MDAHPVADTGTASPHAFTEPALPAALQASLADEFKARQPADIEQECRQFIQQTALTCIELGKRLCFLKSLVQHGEWLPTLERIGIDRHLSSRMMRAAICFLSNAGGLRIVEAAKSKSKLLELLVLDDEEVEFMALGGEVRGITIDALPGMTVAKLRETLKANSTADRISPDKLKMLESVDAKTTATENNAPKAAPSAAKGGDIAAFASGSSASNVIPLDKGKSPTVDDLPLQPGDRIRSVHAKRTGHVVRVYGDGSAAIHWDDREPQPEGLAHERMPRSLLELVKRYDPAAAMARRKDYCRELLRVIARYADDDEVTELARALEDVSANILARRYCPGLNAASYEVFRQYGMKGGAQ